MKQYVKDFSEYFFENEELFRQKKNGTIQKIKIHEKGTNKDRVRVIDDTGTWRWRSIEGIKALAGIFLKLPESAKPIKNTDNSYYIDKEGSVYSFGKNSPSGIKLSPVNDPQGYPTICLSIKGTIRRAVNVHMLMIETFIMEDYSSKGLCCMHLNNIKTDNRLENLAVGTYSQNNKQAYADGLNPGNGLKKIK